MLTILTIPGHPLLLKCPCYNNYSLKKSLSRALSYTSCSVSIAALALFANHNLFHYKTNTWAWPVIGLLASDSCINLYLAFKVLHLSKETAKSISVLSMVPSGIFFALLPNVASTFNSNRKITALLTCGIITFSIASYLQENPKKTDS